MSKPQRSRGITEGTDYTRIAGFATQPYEESIDRVLREVIGNCVPVRFTVHDLQSFMPTKEARIQKVRYHYGEGQGNTPQEITVMNAKGEEVRLRLL